jgi:hypothetical protein
MRALSFLAGVLAIAVFAAATHDDEGCTSAGQPALGIVQITSGSADATFYVDDRNYATGNGIWLYQEYNGVWEDKDAGVYVGDPEHRDLQRGDHCDLVPDDCEICWDYHENGPDWLLF